MFSACVRGFSLLKNEIRLFDRGRQRLERTADSGVRNRKDLFLYFSINVNNIRLKELRRLSEKEREVNLSDDVRIELDKPEYHPGDSITGKVHFTFSETKKVRGIFIDFVGLAQTYWVKVRPEHDFRAGTAEGIMARTAQEEYFRVKYYVVGSNDGEQVEIPQGTHTYDLAATLPPSVPSSFKGEFGSVRYTVAATLDRPWKFNQETKIDFTVINHVDLNSEPAYKEPIHINIEKKFWCLNCTRAPLIVDLRAPVSGYVSGQTIPLSVLAENKSHVELKLVTVKLRELVTYRSKLPHESSKEAKTDVAEVSQGGVAPGETKEFSLELVVPQLTPSKLVGCGIIDLAYDIRMECKVAGAHVSPSQEQLITIGTVPISR